MQTENKFYIRRHCNILTALSRTIRAETCQRLLNHLKHKAEEVMVIISEKKFIVDVSIHQSSRILAKAPLQGLVVLQCSSASIGYVMSPHFIDVGLKTHITE